MTPGEREQFIEHLLEQVHEALDAYTQGEPRHLHLSFIPPDPPLLVFLPPLWTKRPTSHYRRLYGMSLAEMAQQYHRHSTTVWKWLKRGWRPSGRE